jgi:hypothetical protein
MIRATPQPELSCNMDPCSSLCGHHSLQCLDTNYCASANPATASAVPTPTDTATRSTPVF